MWSTEVPEGNILEMADGLGKEDMFRDQGPDRAL